MNKAITIFDKKQYFDDTIRPLRDEFMKACALADIPTFVTSAIANDDGEGTTYQSDMVSAITRNIVLADDKIVKMANVLNGFDIVETNNILEISMD